MPAQSLTSKSAKNSISALLFYAINLILQFISRKVFIDYLGEDILGLNTTLSSILQFLNIAELGIGSAIGYALYKPLYNSDTKAINEIVTLQGWLYKRIAGLIICAGVVIMCFIPLIFEKSSLPLWYSYATFIVLLFSSLLSYFINYRQIVLSADQKEYRIQYSYKASILLKLVFQIIFIKHSENGYVWWLILEFAFAIIASTALSITVKRSYPFLENSRLSGKELISKYPEVLTKTKQLFFHKIGGIALTRVSPIIIYGIATLEMVAIYGNYMLILSGATSLMTAIFSSLNAGIGNLVASGDKTRIKNVFNELFSIRFMITSIICLCTYNLTQPFMRLWMGERLLLDNDCVLLFIGIMFVNLNRLTADAYINAYGMFSDIWAPIAEAALNIILSIIFGHFWGIKGILSGVLVSLIAIIFIWKQYYLFRYGFKEKFINCIKLYIVHIIPVAMSIPIIGAIYRQATSADIYSFTSWIKHACIYAGIATTISGLLFVVFTSGTRQFIRRIINIIRNVF